ASTPRMKQHRVQAPQRRPVVLRGASIFSEASNASFSTLDLAFQCFLDLGPIVGDPVEKFAVTGFAPARSVPRARRPSTARHWCGSGRPEHQAAARPAD